MIAAANDTSIEWQAVGPLSREWIYTGKSGEFMFYPDSQYRQRPQPHPHQAMINQAYADPSIQWQHSSQGSEWSDCLHLSGPQWHIGFNYRQKPDIIENNLPHRRQQDHRAGGVAMTRALLEQAHAALDTCESMTGYYHDERAVGAAMVAITAALAQPEPAPVLWVMTTPIGGKKFVIESESEAKRFAAMDNRSVVPFYSAPTGDKS
jgi:hypothetical protein